MRHTLVETLKTRVTKYFVPKYAEYAKEISLPVTSDTTTIFLHFNPPRLTTHNVAEEPVSCVSPCLICLPYMLF